MVSFCRLSLSLSRILRRELIKNRTTDHNRSAIGLLSFGDRRSAILSQRCQIHIYFFIFLGYFFFGRRDLTPSTVAKRSSKRGRVAEVSPCCCRCRCRCCCTLMSILGRVQATLAMSKTSPTPNSKSSNVAYEIYANLQQQELPISPGINYTYVCLCLCVCV